jgi:hypothetical protein
MAIGELLARKVFQLDMQFNAALMPLSTLFGAILVLAVGWAMARPLLATPALAALRRSA